MYKPEPSHAKFFYFSSIRDRQIDTEINLSKDGETDRKVYRKYRNRWIDRKQIDDSIY